MTAAKALQKSAQAPLKGFVQSEADQEAGMQSSGSQTAPSVQRHWQAAGFLFGAAFINLLDTTIVNLALPAIQAEFDATDTAIQWVLVAYVLAFAAGLLPFGRFGDVFGRRKLFLWGLAGFVASSALCGVAPNMETLIAARLLKGLSAAIMLPQVLAIVHATFPAHEKGKAIGYLAMVSSLGALAGPLIGGAIISADFFGLGWRMIFLINLPLGAISFFGVLLSLKPLPEAETRRPDWLGAALFASGTIALMYPLIEGRSRGWPPQILALFAISLMLFVLFWVRQRRLAERGREQLVPVTLLQSSRFVSGLLKTTLLFTGLAGPVVILAIALQTGLGQSAAGAGLILAAHPLAAMAASLSTGRLGARHLRKRILFGFAALFLGMLSMQRLIVLEAWPLALWGPLTLIGAGAGTAVVALFQSILREVETSDAGAGSGALQALQQIGIALGIAILGQVYFSSLTQADDPQLHVSAFQNVLWLPIAIYAGLIAISLRPALKESSSNDAAFNAPRKPWPVTSVIAPYRK